MNYQEFLDYIKENLSEYITRQEYFGKEESKESEEFCIELHKVTKNNGIILDGLTIRKKDECISPNIYLNSYFESYQMGKPLAVIMEEILYCYQKAKEENSLQVEDILDFSAVKNKIMLRLVNYEKNKELLKNCPHKKYLDLAVTFRYIANKDSLGIASSLISNTEFKVWDIELSELYQIALFNTMREFPWKMESLVNVIADCLKAKGKDILPEELNSEIESLSEIEHKVSMYVLTNDVGINGATCILYDNVIKNFAKVQDSNIFILPSSLHEVMLVPESMETEADSLANLVVDANHSAVGLIDLLSDNIYYYDKEKDQMYVYGNF